MSPVPTRNNAPEATNVGFGERRACDECGALYVPKRPVQRFCKPKCRVANWNASHPRVSIGAVKLEGKPTAQQLEAAGFRVRRRA